MVYSKQVGARVRRKEDPRPHLCNATYVDDLQPRRLAHLAILRSTYAHATILGIDTTAAKALPGVVAVYTGEEFSQLADRMAFGGGEGEGGQPGQTTISIRPIEATRVRHVGQAVAAVVAETSYIARDALDLIDVDYEPLAPVTDMLAAVEPGSPLVYDDVPNNIAYVWTNRTGDPEKAFAEADVVVKQRITNQRLAALPMETRGVVAEPDPSTTGLTVYTSTQNPHTVRTHIAKTLGLSELAVRVVAPEVGGGFGAKIDYYPKTPSPVRLL